MTPNSVADLCDLIRGQDTPIAVQGGGTRAVVNGPSVSTSALSGITLYEPGAMTLVARAGTPLAEVEAALAAENQRLAFEPMDHRGLLGTTGTPTIGGVIATNCAGPRRIQTGAARDHLLGVEFVDGTGTLIKNGGRVMKNVTGYDLVKLMAGSRGTLGALTEVSLKVMPVSETAATIRVETPDPAQGVAALSAALGSPFDVTGAAWLDGVALVRVEGFADSVTYRAKALGDRLGQFGATSVTENDVIWDQIRDAQPLHGAQGDVWRISVKPTDGPRVVDALNGTCFMDWGGGLVWACVPVGTDVRAKLAGISGHATCLRGQGNGPMTHPEPPALATLTQGIKAQFDPKGIFSQGTGV